ncbi:ubiquitin carboxyl-terminal hydrolase 16 isoform X2 [Protopterus annectens]|uniref:ubiquitin carboxyl-terminal hydrolase 16 isoform X2 n=1 Tax=Protopterus annectens TaxID=7888 RepID=UPI001CFA9392|nr:ubiquitin carboxyl-terminal hydrolase 16 isoform X2 [Protopterus annectens]
MGKKKGKGKSSSHADSYSDLSVSQCKHIRKAVDQGHLKKTLSEFPRNVCLDCKADASNTQQSEEEVEESPTIWLCLKCGYQGCGRNSNEKHALKHYETPRSEPHCLVLGLDTWSVWCYICDEEIHYSSSGMLGQALVYIKNLANKDQHNHYKKQQISKTENSDNITTEKEVQNAKEQENKTAANKPEKETVSRKSSEVTVKGLSNLGNTCFFNSVLQNLSQTPVLKELLKEMHKNDVAVTVTQLDSSLPPLIVNLVNPGSLTSAMYQFLTEMHETKKGVVIPKELFSQVCKKAIRFRGFQQQDSHELLRYLLDGMRTEEIKRISAGIWKILRNSTEIMDDETLKNKIKDYEKKGVIKSFVDQIFGGQLSSTIMCENCKTVSLVTESFLDLSLPVLDDQRTKTTEEQKSIFADMVDEDKYNLGYKKERNDTSTISKHQEKKVKKQARKQAKNQRRQQNIKGRVVSLDDHSTEQNNSEIQNNSEDVSFNHSDVADCSQEVKEKSVETAELHCVNLSHEEVTVNRDETLETSASAECTTVTEDACYASDSISDSTNRFQGLYLEDTIEDKEDVSDIFDNLTLNGGILSGDEDEADMEDISKTLETKEYQVVCEDPETAFCTLADRGSINTDQLSVQACLYRFTLIEWLTGANKLQCNNCTQRQHHGKSDAKGEKKFVYTNAQKQMLISLPPAILTLHLKRFQQTGHSLLKINKNVQFPFVLDMAPFCSPKCKNIAEGEKSVLYSLYGVVEHSGSMKSGHYTAFVKVRTPNDRLVDLVLNQNVPKTKEAEPQNGNWFHISDSYVQAVPANKVLSSQAYLLFYERIL